MTDAWDSRTISLLGEERYALLREAKVMVVGLGGVGGYAAEVLVRSGVGAITIVDADEVAESNLNRQLCALRSTIGRPKTDVFLSRFHDVNPDCAVTPVREFVTPDNVASLLSAPVDYVIDAIDTVAPKCALIIEAMHRKIPIISSMGAGGRIDPSRVAYSDLWSTRDDGLARAVRQRLKKAGMKRPLKVVCSSEPPSRHALVEAPSQSKLTSYGTLATIPAIFGLFLANHVIAKITGI